jgi:hypothetical protein
LLRITDHATYSFTFFIPDFTVGITIALLQTVPSLAVLTAASWLSVFDSTLTAVSAGWLTESPPKLQTEEL